jgi:hypothetical protein
MCARSRSSNIAGMVELPELTKHVRHDVFVRSPRRSGLARLLTRMGATVRAESGGGLSVIGMDAGTIASAAAHYIPIQELTPRNASQQTPPGQRANFGLRLRDSHRHTARGVK